MGEETSIVTFFGRHWMLAGLIICAGGWAYMSWKIKRRKPSNPEPPENRP